MILHTWADPSPAPDDLTRLRGIGPGYARRLGQANITTFTELGSLEEHQLLELVGPWGLQRARRDEWLAQARLAAEGDEAGLKALQEKLSDRPANSGGAHGQ
jgi:predicted flap endonuclease-1-like 5' DNA nuclease